MSLRDWSVWRVALVCLAWPVAIALAMFVPVAVIIWRPTPDTNGAPVLPPQWSDVTFSVSSYPVAMLFLVGPPAVLTGIWLWRRSGLR